MLKGILFALFGGTQPASASIWDARACLHESKGNYATLAGHVARLKHLLEDQEKALAYYELQVKRGIEKGDEQKVLVSAAKVVQYRKYVKENQDKIDGLVREQRKLSEDAHVMESKIGGMMARQEAQRARLNMAHGRAALSEVELGYNVAAATADAMEEMAGLSVKEDLFVDKEYEAELQADEVATYLAQVRSKEACQD